MSLSKHAATTSRSKRRPVQEVWLIVVAAGMVVFGVPLVGSLFGTWLAIIGVCTFFGASLVMRARFGR